MAISRPDYGMGCYIWEHKKMLEYKPFTYPTICGRTVKTTDGPPRAGSNSADYNISSVHFEHEVFLLIIAITYA